MPAHHKLETFLDEYLRAAEIAGDDPPLFRSAVRRRPRRCTGSTPGAWSGAAPPSSA
jgi:hypothetical protein